jgi:hypothetical protein
MTRVTPRLLLAIGALLLVAWVVVPLSSSPPQGGTPLPTAPAVAPLPPIAPELDEINREVDRLRDRLAEPVRDVTPFRDPFQFAAAPAEERFNARPPEEEPFGREPERPAIGWPLLVAILSSGSDASPTRQAVLEDASELVHVRSVGDAIGDIVVTAISIDAVTLMHTPSGESTHVALR